jgi:DNA-binding LacI/PurR family transcriptional regulator
MCTEKDPLDCHRTLLVARALVKCGFGVDHILADATLESYEDSMLRLLDKTGQSPQNLFASIDQMIEEAIQKQEARIAYVDKELVTTSDGSAP